MGCNPSAARAPARERGKRSIENVSWIATSGREPPKSASRLQEVGRKAGMRRRAAGSWKNYSINARTRRRVLLG
jgi:hypothetical protein